MSHNDHLCSPNSTPLHKEEHCQHHCLNTFMASAWQRWDQGDLGTTQCTIIAVWASTPNSIMCLPAHREIGQSPKWRIVAWVRESNGIQERHQKCQLFRCQEVTHCQGLQSIFEKNRVSSHVSQVSSQCVWIAFGKNPISKTKDREIVLVQLLLMARPWIYVDFDTSPSSMLVVDIVWPSVLWHMFYFARNCILLVGIKSQWHEAQDVITGLCKFKFRNSSMLVWPNG